MILILMGKSAVGKDTITKHIISAHGFTPIVSDTTRPMRDGETNGVDYTFISLEEFRKRSYIEVRTYKASGDTWYYGCPASDEYVKPEKDFIIVVDTSGAQELIEKLGAKNFVVVCLTASDVTRKLRAMCRGSFDEVEWENRLVDDNKRFAPDVLKNLVDATIPTDQPIEKVATEVIDVYRRCKSERF